LRVASAIAILPALIVSTAVAGCGGSGTTTAGVAHPRTTTHPQTTTGPSRRTTSGPAPPQRARRQGAPVGITQRVSAGTSTLSVTVSKVLDPLPDSGASLLPGTRAAGVEVTIHDRAGATYDSTASGDLSVLTSSGMASPLFIRRGICQTPDADFESLVGPGQTRSGCVGFALPRQARIVAVRFSPHSRVPGRVTWR
jgi:hypothetical protein